MKKHKIPRFWQFRMAIDKVIDKAFGKQVVATRFVERSKIILVRWIVLEIKSEEMGVVTDEKGRKWWYDSKHHQWINVTMPEKLKGKMVKLR